MLRLGGCPRCPRCQHVSASNAYRMNVLGPSMHVTPGDFPTGSELTLLAEWLDDRLSCSDFKPKYLMCGWWVTVWLPVYLTGRAQVGFCSQQGASQLSCPPPTASPTSASPTSAHSPQPTAHRPSTDHVFEHHDWCGVGASRGWGDERSS